MRWGGGGGGRNSHPNPPNWTGLHQDGKDRQRWLLDDAGTIGNRCGAEGRGGGGRGGVGG